MAVSDYAIPWAPPDLLPGIQLLLAARKSKRDSARADRNEEVNRLNADINLRRVNDSIAREHAEFDRRAHDDARLRRQEQAAALEHVNQLARTNPGLAKAYGGAYGIDLREKPQAPPPVPQQETNPLLAAVARPPAAPAEQDLPPAFDLHPGEEGPEVDPAAEAMRFPPPQDAGMPADRMVTIDEPFTIDADVPQGAQPTAAATPATVPGAAAPTNRLFQAVMAGDTYDLDTTQQPTGLGPKYDALYNRYLMEPGGEKTAFAKVMAAWEHEQSQIAQGQRTADIIQGRKDQAGSHEDFIREMNEKYRLTAEQQKHLREMMARAVRDASGAAPTPMALGDVLDVKAAGGSPGDVARAAAGKKLSLKEWTGPAAAVTREAATAARLGEKRDELTATDAKGHDIGMWRDKSAASRGSQQVQRFHRVEERLAELIKDVEQNGERIAPDSKQHVRRMSKAEAVAAALRPYNELSSTDASMKAERAILGPAGAFGHGWVLGADLPTLRGILSEARGQYQANLNALLRPGGGRPLAPSLGGPKGGGDPQVQSAKKWLQANPDADPNLRAKVEAKIKAMEGGGG